jgi:hypothetical protein
MGTQSGTEILRFRNGMTDAGGLDADFQLRYYITVFKVFQLHRWEMSLFYDVILKICFHQQLKFLNVSHSVAPRRPSTRDPSSPMYKLSKPNICLKEINRFISTSAYYCRGNPRH